MSIPSFYVYFSLYLVHAELAHIKMLNFRQEQDIAQDLYHSTALVEATKSLAPSNVKIHDEVPYQKPQLKFMAHVLYPS